MTSKIRVPGFGNNAIIHHTLQAEDFEIVGLSDDELTLRVTPGALAELNTELQGSFSVTGYVNLK